MRVRLELGLILAQVALVVAALAAIASGRVPLGVPGEWEWLRPHGRPEALWVAVAAVAVAVHAGFVVLGARGLAGRPGRALQGAWLGGLLAASAAVQAVVPVGAPMGYGLAKWVTLGLEGSSGYFATAQREVRGLGRFWSDYPGWVAGQDSLHIGTHPPGLLLSCAALRAELARRPTLARRVEAALPDSVRAAFREVLRGAGLTDRAAMAVAGLATLLACAGTVVPLYLLARATLSPSAAWGTAALWPLVPSAILFHPTADTAYPLLAAAALACAAWCARWSWLAVLAGVLLAIGTQFSLAFVPVGLIVGLVEVQSGGAWARRGLGRVLGTGAGFLGVTGALWAVSGANPFVIWWWNARNHHRFYDEYPRTLWAWALANPIELAIGLGLPVAVLACVGLRAGKACFVSWAALGVLVLLTISGRNLGEVARLWLLFFPALMVAAGAAIEGAQRKGLVLGASVTALGAQTVALQTLVQVVYPV